MRNTILSSFAAMAVLAACGGDPATEPARWQGSAPHFSLRGTINGEELDLSITGDAAVSSLLWCKLEYVAPLSMDGSVDYSRVRHVATEVDGALTVGDEERTFELELRNHSLQNDPQGTSVQIVPRLDGIEPAADAMWMDWEWHSADGEDLYESSAQDGRFTLEQLNGTLDANGMFMPDGTALVGGVAEARWSLDESLSISFSAPCTEVEFGEQ